MWRARRSDVGAHPRALHAEAVEANRGGRHRDAARLLVQAIAAAPGVAEFHYELGRAMRGLGEPERAVTSFRNAIDLDPAHLDARVDLASALLALGDADGAAEAARAALALDPRSIAASVNLGAALEGQGNTLEAADCYQAALAQDAGNVAALANLSAVRLQLGGVDEARRLIDEAVRISPEDPGMHLRLGNVLLEQRLPAQAAESFRTALRLRPGDPAAWNALGFAHDLQGDLQSAMRFYDRALASDPDDVEAHLNRAGVWIAQGDYPRGWEEYEWRLRSRLYAPLYGRYAYPRWDGSALAGRRILVYAEQGLGDELLFASCLPQVVAQAAHCVIDCEPRLAGLFRDAFPQAAVHGGRQTDDPGWTRGAGRIDVQVPAGSLPLYLRRHAADFPAHQGYLRAQAERVARWRERLRDLGPGRKIGLSWRGGVPRTGRGSRSLRLEQLLPLLRMAGHSFVSLQYGSCHEEIARMQAQNDIRVHHWPEAISDYDETAALVTALDLTVSVCTALVDLGGALGRPVWVLAPVRSDFRYGISGESLCWYPSVRVFRQARYADWEPVIAAAAAALREGA